MLDLIGRKGIPEIADFIIRLRERQSAWSDAHGANHIPGQGRDNQA